MTPRPATILFILASAAGLLFAAVSTFDFVQHLDRQLHGIHCSFIPGLGALDASGSSGCSAALMSNYSSVLRGWVWGGIPISLAGMAVFAFLLFRGMDLILGRRQGSSESTGLLALIAMIPVLTSIAMGAIALIELGELCKLCVGIYISSFVALGAAGWAWFATRSSATDRFADGEDEPRDDEEDGLGDSPLLPYLIAAGQAAGFVAVPLLVYVLMAPDFTSYVGTCGTLTRTDDPYGVLVPLDNNVGGTPVIEVMDPLCPACRGFEHRFGASGLGEQIHRQALLFPLDNSCNWMVSSALHPGACAVSAAVLCADDPVAVLDWAFTEQAEIRAAAANNPEAPGEMVAARFPGLASCIRSNKARSKLNRSMRWAVSNQLPVMMPQVFVDGVKLCDEDTDLGLDYALPRLMEQVTTGVGLSPDMQGGRVEVGG